MGVVGFPGTRVFDPPSYLNHTRALWGSCYCPPHLILSLTPRSSHLLLTVTWMNAPAETPRRKRTSNCGRALLPAPWRPERELPQEGARGE